MSDLLKYMVKGNCSDLILKAGRAPLYRYLGDVLPLGEILQQKVPNLTDNDIVELGYSIMRPDQIQRFEERMELDASYQLPDVARFRVNMFRQRGMMGVAIRCIPIEIRTVEQVGVPGAIVRLCERPRGMILVTGPTGSGKSTTLAGLIHHINETRGEHIITIEDPIEFVHEDRQSILNQRELGDDTHSFANALRSALREDPDVVLIGEMRDLETIELAITAAETGHLVFGTLHTTDAVQTVDRIIDVFPPDQQGQIRLQVASSLLGVCSQTLLKRSDESARVPAFEVMICTNAIRGLIREAKTHQIESLISVGARHGMRTLNQDLSRLVVNGVCNKVDAVEKSPYPDELGHMIDQELKEKHDREALAARRR
ncbi:MAG: type IV pilus twitching motility protein PilT [Fimbriimonadaceae bacterium]|nr:type IV pilus twitching motility protein PilT [Fimbriimonadaceae bacterium]